MDLMSNHDYPPHLISGSYVSTVNALDFNT